MKSMGNILRVLFVAIVATALTLSASAAPKSKTDKTTSDATSAKSARSSSAKIDVNTATEEELETLPGVGKSTAKKIISNRPYSSITDLKKAGLSEKTIQKLQPMAKAGRAHVSEPSGAAASSTESAPKARRSRPATTESQTTESTPKVSSSTSSVSSDAAAAKGMVWVNTDSKVYHKPGDHWYGKTKEGTYMTEQQAIANGYRASGQTEK